MSANDSNTVDLSLGLYRRIYGGATKDRRINSVSVMAEMLFWRVHCVADDYGAFEADPYLLRVAAMPLRQEMTNETVRSCLDELSSAGLVTFYTVGQERYGLIVGFTDRQPANRNGKRIRRCPAPPPDEPPASAVPHPDATPPGDSGGIQMRPGESRCMQGNFGESEKSCAEESESVNGSGGMNGNKVERPPPMSVAEPPVVHSAKKMPSLHRSVDPPEIPPALQTPAFAAAWSDFKTHRNEMGRPMTSKAESEQIAWFAEMGETRAVNALRYSLRSGYVGVVEDKPKIQSGKGTPSDRNFFREDGA